MSFALKYGKFCLETLSITENYRAQQRLAPLGGSQRAALEDDIRFTTQACLATKARLDESLNRIKGQINVVRAPASMIP
jgi:hypothetical protein